MTTFKHGDSVRWSTPQGETKGHIVKKVISDTSYEGLDITASRTDPRFIVQSDSTGKYAAHKPESLQKD